MVPRQTRSRVAAAVGATADEPPAQRVRSQRNRTPSAVAVAAAEAAAEATPVARPRPLAAAEEVAVLQPEQPAQAAQPAVPVLPALPTFEPRVVAPLVADTAQDVAASIADDCQCGICHDLMVGPHALTCGHSFCGECAWTWMRTRPTCPICRERTAKPAYERIMDDLICSVVEPRLNAKAMADRNARKKKWQELQVDYARHARERETRRASAIALAAATPGGALAALENGGPLAVQIHRLFRQSNETLQVNLRELYQRHGLRGAPESAWPAAAPPPPPEAQSINAGGGGISWSVEYALGSRTLCLTCFNNINEGAVRVVRAVAAPRWANATADETEQPMVRSFHHFPCRVPLCPPELLGGLNELTERHRQHVIQDMAAVAAADAAVAARAAAAAAAAAAPVA